MMFNLKELTLWLGVTTFEILLYVMSILISTLLLGWRSIVNEGKPLTHDDIWLIFTPLFAADALNFYFCIIVFVRTNVQRSLKAAVVRGMWSFFFISCLAVFETALAHKLTGMKEVDYCEVFASILLMLQLIAIRACQVHS